MNLTSEEIDKLEAGRGLDKIVAKEVMGWSHFVERSVGFEPHLFGRDPDGYHFDVPAYSTSIDSAWEVVEKTKLLEYYKLCKARYQTLEDGWSIGEDVACEEWGDHVNNWKTFAWAKTFPLCVCKAALKTLIGSTNHL